MTYLKFVEDKTGRPYNLACNISDLKKQLEGTRTAYFSKILDLYCSRATSSFSPEIKQLEEIIASLKSQIHSLDCQFRSYYGCYLDDLVLTDDK